MTKFSFVSLYGHQFQLQVDFENENDPKIEIKV